MTKLLLKLSGVALLFAALIFTGCGDDTTGDNVLGPEISFVDGEGLISTDTDLDQGETFTVQIDANIGDNPLKTLTFLVDGTEPSASEINNYVKSITTNGNAVTPNNPLLITTNANGGIWTIEMVPFAQEVDEFVTYGFEVEDEAGETAIATITIGVIDTGTELEMDLTGVLFNQAGPAGTGGLDLDTGNGTGSSAAGSELRDLGLDCTITPGTGENWRRQMGTINGANMVAIDPLDVGENFNFADVKTQEEVLAAYDAGTSLNNGTSTSCTNGSTTNVSDVTDAVAVGDIFGVFANNRYYLIQVNEVNPVASSNNDNYVLSIKY